MKQSSKLPEVPRNKLVFFSQWQNWSLLPESSEKRISPCMATAKGAKNIHTLSKCSTVLIMSSGKKLSAKVAQQGRDQKTQHRMWLEGTNKVLEVTYPTGTREIHIKLRFFLCSPSPPCHIRPEAADA